MKIKNIEWNVNLRELAARFVDENADASIINMELRQYQKMTDQEKKDSVFDYFRRRPAEAEKYLGLPDEIDLPDPDNPEWDPETITMYLAETYGCYLNGYVVDV